MRVTEQGRIRPVVSAASYLGGEVGPSGQVLISNGSNTVSWGSNIGTIWSNGSNQLLGPHVNFASGSNVHFAAASNTLTIHALGVGGGAAISGITVKDEGVSLGAEATTLDFVGAGVTASGSGTTKTITISGSGGSSSLHEDGFTKPDSAGTYDEEFEGTADTLPTNWSWISTPSTWKLNSQWKSRLVVEHPGSTSETKELRRASFTPGAVDFGIWWHMGVGSGRWNNNTNSIDLYILDSAEANGMGVQISYVSTQLVDWRQLSGGVDTRVNNGYNSDYVAPEFFGLTRKTSDNTWRMYYSWDGVSWTSLNGTPALSVTVDRIRIRFTSGNNTNVQRDSVDFVRYRSDLLLWAPR